MTTRAGSAGLISGVLAALIIYPLYSAWHQAALNHWPAGMSLYTWIGIVVVGSLMLGGGLLAGRWSKSTQPARSAALGGLAGLLGGTVVFCLWGAAAAGSLYDPMIGLSADRQLQSQTITMIVDRTMKMYLALFLGGIIPGVAGGYLAGSQRPTRSDEFDMAEPQMAMNAAITATAASLVAVIMAAAIFARLAHIVGQPARAIIQTGSIVDLPLAVSLLLLLVSHFALTLVVPHEARQAEHRCGLDEVKMAAFVGIGASPLLTLLLSLVDISLLSKPLILIALLACSGLSLISLHSLLTLILPKRATFPAPPEDSKRIEASLFGSIAKSRGSRLVVLCIGCGLVMVLPLYVAVLSVLINLGQVMDNSAFRFIPAGPWRLFQIQALVSGGLMAAAAALLSAIYLFYLNLGRWFSRWNARRSL